jgi:hypothetical protein
MHSMPPLFFPTLFSWERFQPLGETGCCCPVLLAERSFSSDSILIDGVMGHGMPRFLGKSKEQPVVLALRYLWPH